MFFRHFITGALKEFSGKRPRDAEWVRGTQCPSPKDELALAGLEGSPPCNELSSCFPFPVPILEKD